MSEPGGEIAGETLAEAAAWLARLRADDCSEDDRRGFFAWAADDPARAAAFQRVTAAFEMVGRAEDLHLPRLPIRRAAASPLSRRAVMAGGVLGAAALGATGWQAAAARTIETQIGERRAVRLDGGGLLTVDADSRLERAWLSDRRFRLARGRISLRTGAAAPDLLVDAGRWRIETRDVDADIACLGGAAAVVVASGAAEVLSADGRSMRLGAGDTRLADGRVLRVALEREMAWRTGRLVFDRTPLAEACRALNRYDPSRLAPVGAAGGLLVSGTFQAGHNAAFARAIAAFLPIRAHETADGAIMLQPTG